MKFLSSMEASVKWSVSAGLCLLLQTALPLQAKDRPPSIEEEQPSILTECSPLLEPLAARRALQLVRAQLQAQGMQLVVQACPFVRVGVATMQQVVDVRVLVANSDVAANFVRGPLADGEEVDMGGVHLAAPSLAQGMVKTATALQEDVSPDVLFNRQWLIHVMKNRGLQAVDGHWWAFVPSTAGH